MGTPKALLEWAGTTLLDHALQEARAAAAADIVVVLGPATAHLASELMSKQASMAEAHDAAADRAVAANSSIAEAVDASAGSAVAIVRVVVNPDPETGRSASIRLAAKALADHAAASRLEIGSVLIQSVDQ